MNEKKARRKARRHKERQAHRDLDAVTTDAIEQAAELAPIVAQSNERSDRERKIDVELASLSEAQFVRKRVNEALRVDEWLDELSVDIVTGAEQEHQLLLRRTVS